MRLAVVRGLDRGDEGRLAFGAASGRAGAFAAEDTVRAYLQVAGSEGLPVTLVDGVVVATGTYPSRAQLLRFAGTAAPQPTAPAGSTGLALLEEPTAGDAGCGCGPEGCS